MPFDRRIERPRLSLDEIQARPCHRLQLLLPLARSAPSIRDVCFRAARILGSMTEMRRSADVQPAEPPDRPENFQRRA